MSNPPGTILFFYKYVHTDTQKSKARHALLLIPEDKTEFINSIWCCVLSTKDEKFSKYRRYCVPLKSSYNCFCSTTYAHTHKVELQEKKYLSRKNPRGILNGVDIKNTFRKLQSFLSSNLCYLQKEIKATILREWMLFYKNKV